MKTKSDWEIRFENIFNSEGYDHIEGNGRSRIKDFIRQLLFQVIAESHDEGYRKALEDFGLDKLVGGKI